MTTKADKTLHDERKNILGGSDIGALWNMDFGCRRKLYYEKSGQVPDFPPIERPEFERGKYMEPVVAALYADKTGRKVRLTGLHVHPEYPKLGVHMDRIVETDERPSLPGYLEIKVVRWNIFKKFKREGLRDSYILQVQEGLGVTGYTWGSYAILCLDPWDFKYFDVERDEELITKIITEANKFWLDVYWGNKPEALAPNDPRCATCEYRATCQGEKLTALAGDINLEDFADLPAMLPVAAEYHELKKMENEVKSMIEEVKISAEQLIGRSVKGAKYPGGYSRWINLEKVPEEELKREWDKKALTSMYDKGSERLKALLDPYYRKKSQGAAHLRHYWTGEK